MQEATGAREKYIARLSETHQTRIAEIGFTEWQRECLVRLYAEPEPLQSLRAVLEKESPVNPPHKCELCEAKGFYYPTKERWLCSPHAISYLQDEEPDDSEVTRILAERGRVWHKGQCIRTDNADGLQNYNEFIIWEKNHPLVPRVGDALVIAPVCYGCGLGTWAPANAPEKYEAFSCGNVTSCNITGDPLVDFDEHKQFSVSIPVRVKGKDYGKARAKTVTFNSVACANLTLKNLARKESRVKNDGHKYGNIVSYPDAKTLGQYRAEQGWKRCTCRQLHKEDEAACSRLCREAYDTVEYLESLKPVAEAAVKKVRLHLCGYKNCAEGPNRTRGRVAVKGDGCSKRCRQSLKILKKRTASASLMG